VAIELTVLFTIQQSRIVYLMVTQMQLAKMCAETQCLCSRVDRITPGDCTGKDEESNAYSSRFDLRVIRIASRAQRSRCRESNSAGLAVERNMITRIIKQRRNGEDLGTPAVWVTVGARVLESRRSRSLICREYQTRLSPQYTHNSSHGRSRRASLARGQRTTHLSP
jgi:hypothetical protein